MNVSINPKIITWARNRSGLTIEALAGKMKKDPREVEMWEQGLKSPSYARLEELAYKHLKIPIAVFFFPEPPALDDPVRKFRRLPDFELARFSYDTLQKIRLAQTYQESLRELVVGAESGKKIFQDLNPEGVGPSQLADQVRQFLAVDIKEQFAWRSSEQAFKFWRHAIENAGVFAFKDSFKDRHISGFCLLDPEWPIVFINNSNSYTRQTFTIVHELGHILFGIHGVTDIDETYLQYMGTRPRALEIKCNRFAGQLLVPDAAFREEIGLFVEVGPDIIPTLADKYSVSREVILRKLLEHRAITTEFYQAKADEWTRDYLRRLKARSGGNYYLTKLAYLGEGFTRLAFANYSAGRFDQIQLANHLNMNSANLPKLGRYLRW